MTRILIVYYSYSNSTKNLAEKIQTVTNGHMRELVPEKPYDFSCNGETKRVRNEISNQHCPKLLAGCESVQNHDCVFVGTPNWFHSFAPPILSFLRSVDLSAKTVVPFCTHGGGGFGQIETKIAEECPNSKVLLGFASGFSFDERQFKDWMANIFKTDVILK